MLKKVVCVIMLSWGGMTFAQTSGQPHVVAAGETLYGIARNYNIHISELLKANPQIIDNAIKPGDVVTIPGKKNGDGAPAQTVPSQKAINNQPFGTTGGAITPVAPAQPAKVAPALPAVHQAQQATNGKVIYHEVQEKQTLYAISKLYNVSVQDIITWNNLQNNGIQVGSTLMIRPGKEMPVTVKADTPVKQPVTLPVQPSVTNTVVATPELPVSKPKMSTGSSLQAQLEQVFVAAKDDGGAAQTTRGTIAWINTENPKMSESYFALHKSAPVGTIVKVTNLVNKRVVFVKVIGKLPETADNINIVLRLSSAAKKDLLLNGDKAYVDMEYYQ